MRARAPAGSIIERFRGTEWGTPEPAPPPPPRRGRGPVPLVAAILVLGGTLAGVALLASPQNEGDRPELHASFLPDDGITPRVPDSIRILDAFWAVARDPELAYHLEGTGGSTAEGFDSSFELRLDVVGDDYSGTVNTIGGTGLADIIRVDHVVYVRPTGGAWLALRTDDRTLRQLPFMGLEGRRELVYDGTLEDGGRTLHRLVTTKFYAPSVERMLDLAGFTLRPDTLSLVLLVSDAGVPVRATFRCTVDGSPVDGIPHFEGTAEYEFRAFGVPAAIATPAGATPANATPIP